MIKLLYGLLFCLLFFPLAAAQSNTNNIIINNNVNININVKQQKPRGQSIVHKRYNKQSRKYFLRYKVGRTQRIRLYNHRNRPIRVPKIRSTRR